MKTIYTTTTFNTWFGSLRDRQGKLRIQARIDRATFGHYGDVKPVGDGVSEIRINTGPGYRVYFIEQGLEIIVLLAGGDKSSQSSDIKIAIQLAKEQRQTP